MAMTTEAAQRIIPVILAGGSGSRLWPLSREDHPKQLLQLHGQGSMLQETLRRVSDPGRFAPAIVVTSENLRFAVAQQIADGGFAIQTLLLEPEPRNTAPALAAAALLAQEADPGACLLALPSDHAMAEPESFLELVAVALPAARSGRLVTFGVPPSRPETGYGYIHLGRPLPDGDGLCEVAAFVEKPNQDQAARLLADGRHLWNSGMVLFRADILLMEMARHAPDILPPVARAVTARRSDLDFQRLEAGAWSSVPSISIDYAVMEKTEHAAVLPARIGWSDLGVWSEVWSQGDKDESGNVIVGDAMLQDSSHCLAMGQSRLTVGLGLRNLMVVTTDDAVLVADMTRAQDIRSLVEDLKQAGRPEATQPSTVSRPWGSFRSVLQGEGFQVKCLTLRPGAGISLQTHRHRSEHWVVVEGTAQVSRNGENLCLSANESIYIPAGCPHRLDNPGPGPLNIIEVQTGSYLGEDDICRLDDPWRRN